MAKKPTSLNNREPRPEVSVGQFDDYNGSLLIEWTNGGFKINSWCLRVGTRAGSNGFRWNIYDDTVDDMKYELSDGMVPSNVPIYIQVEGTIENGDHPGQTISSDIVLFIR